MIALGKRLLEGWLAIAARFGEVQTLLVLTLLYFLVFGPFAVALAATRRDFLDRRGFGAGGSGWRELERTQPDLDRARHPF